MKSFSGLADILNGMRENEPTCNLPKPKGSKQTREAPTDARWQPLAEMNHPLPGWLQVHLKLGKHPKTGASQWIGFYQHGQRQLKVICDPNYRHELPADGEIWAVRVTNQIPGIVFAVAETPASLVAAQEAERVKRGKDRALWLASAGESVTVNVHVPQDPQLSFDDVDGAVTGYGYSGKLESVMVEGDTWTIVIIDVWRSSRGWDVCDGSFETDSRPYAGRHTFTLCHVEVAADRLEGCSEHRFGQSFVYVYR